MEPLTNNTPLFLIIVVIVIIVLVVMAKLPSIAHVLISVKFLDKFVRRHFQLDV